MASLSKAAVIWTVVVAGALSIIGCESGGSSSPPKTIRTESVKELQRWFNLRAAEQR
ncbi:MULTISPECIES: hypothetical protein [Paenibacillus]|uniref:hypothetical protein n=1 Tax=Paenibacillus TaxID=44249 RepID=UPI0016434FFF|nr:hypothetical protein [Paenibacillus sp. IHBB 10380]